MKCCKPPIINFIEHVDPLVVSKYLEITGWKRFPRKRTDIRIYQLPICNDDFYQVTIPFDENLGDYKEALSEAVLTIAEAEGKTESEVMKIFLHPNSDILCIKISNSSANERFSLQTIESFYKNTKKLLKTTAQDVVNPQKTHKGRADSKSLDFANNCSPYQEFLSNGKLLISLAIPLENIQNSENCGSSAQSRNGTTRDSFARLVDRKLLHNISLVKQITENKEYPYYFWSEYNISSNFCDSLAKMSKLGSEIEFSFEWSPFTQNNPVAESIKFSRNDYRFLSSISQKIKSE